MVMPCVLFLHFHILDFVLAWIHTNIFYNDEILSFLNNSHQDRDNLSIDFIFCPHTHMHTLDHTDARSRAHTRTHTDRRMYTYPVLCTLPTKKKLYVWVTELRSQLKLYFVILVVKYDFPEALMLLWFWESFCMILENLIIALQVCTTADLMVIFNATNFINTDESDDWWLSVEWYVPAIAFLQSNVSVILFFTDQRDIVQKKTFTKWVNKHLVKVIILSVLNIRAF